MQQYFINEKFKNKSYLLSSEDSFHILKVMRKTINDKIFVVFSDEDKYVCIINNIVNNLVEVLPYEKVERNNELTTKIIVAIPPLKSTKLEFLLQKCTELGVNEIILFNSERNISKMKSDKVLGKLIRYEKILKEAAEQSKRNIIPSIKYVNDISELINNCKDIDYKLIAYEKESDNLENKNFKNILNNDLVNKSIICVFGSEGGLSEKEVTIFENNEYKTIGLGKRILRAETAPIYFISCVSFFSELN